MTRITKLKRIHSAVMEPCAQGLKNVNPTVVLIPINRNSMKNSIEAAKLNCEQSKRAGILPKDECSDRKYVEVTDIYDFPQYYSKLLSFQILWRTCVNFHV